MKVYVYAAKYNNSKEEKKITTTKKDIELAKKIIISKHGSKGLEEIKFSHFYYIPY